MCATRAARAARAALGASGRSAGEGRVACVAPRCTVPAGRHGAPTAARRTQSRVAGAAAGWRRAGSALTARRAPKAGSSLGQAPKAGPPAPAPPTGVLLHEAHGLKLLHDVADQAAAGLLKVLGLAAAGLVAAAELDAQLAHAEALAHVDLARDGRCGGGGGWGAAVSGSRSAAATRRLPRGSGLPHARALRRLPARRAAARFGALPPAPGAAARFSVFQAPWLPGSLVGDSPARM